MKGSLVLTTDGKVLHCSPTWLIATGDTEENVVDRMLLQHATDCSPVPSALLDQMRRGKGHIRCRWSQQSRSGDLLVCTAELRLLDIVPYPRLIYGADVVVESKFFGEGYGPTSRGDIVQDTHEVAYTVADVSDPKRPLTFVSTGFVALTNYDASDCLGRSCSFLQGPASEPEAIGALRHAIRHRTQVRATITNYRRDGTQFLNRLIVHPLLIDGACNFMLGIQYAIPDSLEEAKLEPLPLLEEVEAVARHHQAMVQQPPPFQVPLGVGMIGLFLFAVLMMAGFFGLGYSAAICQAREGEIAVLSEGIFNSTQASVGAALDQVVAFTQMQHQRVVTATMETPNNRTYVLQQYELFLRSAMDGLTAAAAGAYFQDGRAVYLLKTPGWLARCTAQGLTLLVGQDPSWNSRAMQLCGTLQTAVVQWDGAGGSGWVQPLVGGSAWVFAMGVSSNSKASNRTGTIVTALLTDSLKLGASASSPTLGSAAAVLESSSDDPMVYMGDLNLKPSALVIRNSLQGNVAGFQEVAGSRRYVVAKLLSRFDFSFTTVYISTPKAKCGMQFGGIYGLAVWYLFTGLSGLGLLYAILDRHCASIVRALRHARRFKLEAAFEQLTRPSLARFVPELWCQREWTLQMCQQLELWRHLQHLSCPSPKGVAESAPSPDAGNMDEEEEVSGADFPGKDPSAKYRERRPPPPHAIQDDWHVATMMHASLQGFGALADQLECHTFLELHRQYIDTLHTCVAAAQGTFHHFIGDRVLASWNVIAKVENAERQACSAATDSVAATKLINRRLQCNALTLHVGLAKGSVLAAVMGCPRYRTFNLLGTPCDLARDIGRINWVLGTHVLAEDAVARSCRTHFDVRLADIVATPDTPDDALFIHEIRQPLKAEGPLPRPFPLLPPSYAEAVERFLEGDVTGCKALLLHFLEDYRDDGPARLFLWAAHRPVQPRNHVIHPLDCIPLPQQLGVEL
eukprot:GGOE01056867.1.p1 GENE.GGOE01056867.1~~GGOE01056867.1.p1  ORF type:complete len:967 (-),score=216.68 GGOE01056867.1:214-3114(-)